MLFPNLGPSSLPVVVSQPDERYANRTTASVLEWYHTTSSSNEAKKLRHFGVFSERRGGRVVKAAEK